MMQNFYILMSTLFMSISIKSTSYTVPVENQSNFDYKFVVRPLNIERDSQKFLTNSGESWLNTYRNKEDETMEVLPKGTDVSSIENGNIEPRHSNSQILSDDDVIGLLQSYVTHVANFRSKDNANYDDFEWPVKYPQKRALTMLSRWNVFRIPNSIGGNGRHVIRSPFISKMSDPKGYGRMQIMGRPFRWG